MSKKELDVIEQAELALTNSKSNSDIKETLTLFGYNPKEIGEGETLLEVVDKEPCLRSNFSVAVEFDQIRCFLF